MPRTFSVQLAGASLTRGGAVSGLVEALSRLPTGSCCGSLLADEPRQGSLVMIPCFSKMRHQGRTPSVALILSRTAGIVDATYENPTSARFTEG